MMASPWLLNLFNTHKVWKSVTIVTLIYGAAFYCMKMRSIGVMIIPDALYVVLEGFYLLFSFMCGALLAKYGIPQLGLVKNNLMLNNVVLIAFIGVLSFIRSLIDNAVTSPILCLVLIVLVANIHFADNTKKVFEEIGRHSLDMWFIHAYFTYRYLDFTVYWMEYPLLIFLAVVIYSYLLSKLFHKVLKQLGV